MARQELTAVSGQFDCSGILLPSPGKMFMAKTASQAICREIVVF
jgi:hypothetical protein